MTKNRADWEIVADKVLAEYRIFTVRGSVRINPRTGNPFEFLLIDGLDWVNIIPFTEQGEVVLVRQYRHGSESYTLEIPGGAVEPDDPDPERTALRELLEETGYAVEKAEHLGTLHPNPAMLSNRLHCYVAYGAKRVRAPQLDPGEDIQMVTAPLSEVQEMIRGGKITHSLVVAAFGLYQLSRPERSGS